MIKESRVTGKCIECNNRTQGRTSDDFLCRKCRLDKDFVRRTEELLQMNPYDFGWLVGIIEGEGCFYKKDSKCKLRDGYYCYPLVGFTTMSTDEDVMIRISELLHLKINGPYYKSW